MEFVDYKCLESFVIPDVATEGKRFDAFKKKASTVVLGTIANVAEYVATGKDGRKKEKERREAIKKNEASVKSAQAKYFTSKGIDPNDSSAVSDYKKKLRASVTKYLQQVARKNSGLKNKITAAIKENIDYSNKNNSYKYEYPKTLKFNTIHMDSDSISLYIVEAPGYENEDYIYEICSEEFLDQSDEMRTDIKSKFSDEFDVSLLDEYLTGTYEPFGFTIDFK